MFDTLAGSLQAWCKAGCKSSSPTQRFRGSADVYLGHKLGQVIAKPDGVACTHPLFLDDAPHNLSKLLCWRCGSFRAHALECAELTGLEEEPGHPKSPLLSRDLICKHQGLDKGSHAIALEALWKQIVEAGGDLFEGATVRVAIVHDLDQFNRPTLHNLVEHHSTLEEVGLLLPVWLEATDVMQIASAQSVKKGLQVLSVFLRNASEQWALGTL
mmetsp:Transcript_131498/g.327952  ORF Transcript_131498/g.327952 Transcript_131498/m.327952 type:complete len:214 (-) Transcript_131498:1951-2592(-)